MLVKLLHNTKQGFFRALCFRDDLCLQLITQANDRSFYGFRFRRRIEQTRQLLQRLVGFGFQAKRFPRTALIDELLERGLNAIGRVGTFGMNTFTWHENQTDFAMMKEQL